MRACFTLAHFFVSASIFETPADRLPPPPLSPAVCQEACCVNLATALALLLGDQPALRRFAAAHPGAWDDLYALVANDVHLCSYAPVLSPLPSPIVQHQQQQQQQQQLGGLELH